MNNIKIKNFNWAFTNRCNLKCLHCIVSSGKEKKNELSIQEAKDVVDQLYKLNCCCIHFTGGECLSKPGFFEVAQYCKHKGIDVTLVTNGTLIDKNNIGTIKNIFHDIRISLNGVNKGSHDAVRGEGNFEKTISAVRLINNENIPLIFFVTLRKSNFHDINKIIQLCKRYKAVGFKIDYTVLGGRAVNYKDKFYLDDQQIKWLISEFCKNFNGRVQEDDKCNINNESLYLTADGYVYPCVHLALDNKVKYCLGNVRAIPVESMIKELQKSIGSKYKNRKCVHKFYSYGNNYILGTRNLNDASCLI